MSASHLKNIASSHSATRKSILKKTIEVGSSTLLSRMLGLAREILLVQFLGAGPLSDAFFTAYKIPNSLRKIFAEGALSAAFIPTFVKVIKENSKQEVSKLMSLSFLVIEGILITLCSVIFWKAEWIVKFIAPGWFLNKQCLETTRLSTLQSAIAWIAPAWVFPCTGIEQALYAIQFLRILITFILLLSCSALLASALQSVNHFFVMALSPILLNIVFITGLICCIHFNLSVNTLCYFILAGGFLQFLCHLIVYFKRNFSFLPFDKKTAGYFYEILAKFLPCLFAMSLLEINLFVITTLATYLPAGSISLINYSNRFMGIPLGIFATAFSTILLPYFSRISTYAPKRLSLYILEAAKFIFWVTIPATLIMIVLAKKIFLTLFLSEKFTLAQVDKASSILIIFLFGLFIFSLNKVLLNIFYALHDTLSPTIISIFVALCNYFFCKIFIVHFGVCGLALGFLFASILQTFIFLLMLPYKFDLKLYLQPFWKFCYQSLWQIGTIIALFVITYYVCQETITRYTTPSISLFLLEKSGFWLWIFPLIGIITLLFFKTRQLFGIKLLFLD